MIIRSKAPLRISFAGGGTDVSPYADERGGVVLSATIDKYAYASLRPRQDENITVQSLDYDIVAKYHVTDVLEYDGEMDLVKAVLQSFGPRDSGFDFFLHTDAPPGSGLGSSSTMVVALIGALKHLYQVPIGGYQMADLAYRIEREDLGIKGGMQDQYAAVFGGFNFMEFSGTSAIVNPLRTDPDIINELEYNLRLCYTGKRRLSAKIIESQVAGYMRRDHDVLGAMDELKSLTISIKNALLQGRLDAFGRLLHESWLHKKRMARDISNPEIDKLYETARSHGAIGGKITGAGGGGYLFLYCEFGTKHIIAEALEKLGAEIVDFSFEPRGLQTWEIRP
jgi:D-glycero-alpha-D-manno-heptose-7-phosphate kinase